MLRKHPLHKIVTYTGTLKAAPTIQNWGELAEITLCQVITFHDRGGGEVSKMLQRSMYNGQTGRNQQQKELKIVYSQLRRRCVRGIK